jgi:hypothetical protein
MKNEQLTDTFGGGKERQHRKTTSMGDRKGRKDGEIIVMEKYEFTIFIKHE